MDMKKLEKRILAINCLLLALVLLLGAFGWETMLSVRRQARSVCSDIETRAVAVLSEIRYPSISSDDYVPMRGEGARIDADQLDSPVNTGTDASFDPLFCFYRTMLGGSCQQVYNQVYANALACNRGRFTLIEPLDEASLSDVMTAVYNDHPELFWLDGDAAEEEVAAIINTLFVPINPEDEDYN